jgi:hypothetical protein
MLRMTLMPLKVHIHRRTSRYEPVGIPCVYWWVKWQQNSTTVSQWVLMLVLHTFRSCGRRLQRGTWTHSAFHWRQNKFRYSLLHTYRSHADKGRPWGRLKGNIFHDPILTDTTQLKTRNITECFIIYHFPFLGGRFRAAISLDMP